MQYLRVARIVNSIGLDGEVKIFSTTSFKEIRYKKGNKLYILVDNDYIPVTVKSFRIKDAKFDAISFKEFTSVEQVENLKNHDIFCMKDESILLKNEFYYDDLKDLKVYDEDKKEVGITIEIEEFPANLTLKIKTIEGKISFVPFNDFFIKNVDLENKAITIHVIEGLLWDLLF